MLEKNAFFNRFIVKYHNLTNNKLSNQTLDGGNRRERGQEVLLCGGVRPQHPPHEAGQVAEVHWVGGSEADHRGVLPAGIQPHTHIFRWVLFV